MPSIEVIATVDGWTWRILATCGRVIVYTPERYPTDLDAFNGGKNWRTIWMTTAARHRRLEP